MSPALPQTCLLLQVGFRIYAFKTVCACLPRLLKTDFLVAVSTVLGLTVIDLCNRSFCFCEDDTLEAFMKVKFKLATCFE